MNHTRSQFDADLQALRGATTAMADLVERQLMRAVEAVRAEDIDGITQVLADETEVNRMHVQNDLRCHRLIAKHQPIAVDLREIIAILHTSNDLERIGDEAKKIALKARELAGRPALIDGARVERMAVIAGEMLRAAVEAFVGHDPAVAAQLKVRDREVNRLRDELVGDLVELMGREPQAVAQALALVFIVQSIERIGDHAKNISEYVVTVVEGTDPRYAKSMAKQKTRSSERENRS